MHRDSSHTADVRWFLLQPHRGCVDFYSDTPSEAGRLAQHCTCFGGWSWSRAPGPSRVCCCPARVFPRSLHTEPGAWASIPRPLVSQGPRSRTGTPMMDSDEFDDDILDEDLILAASQAPPARANLAKPPPGPLQKAPRHEPGANGPSRAPLTVGRFRLLLPMTSNMTPCELRA